MRVHLTAAHHGGMDPAPARYTIRTSGRKAGRRACGSRRSHWPAAPTRSDLSPSSPAAAGPSPSTCSPRCWSASRPRSSSCFCVPPCSTGVNGELADLLTGHPGAGGILLDLEDANAFVVSLDPARTWFRYHHLFADLLRLELRRRLPGQLPALHRLAAGWLSEHGEIVEAIRHTQAAGDWSDAARLLADHSFSPDARRAGPDDSDAAASLPAGCRHRGSGYPAGPGHQRPCPGTSQRCGRPPDRGRNHDRRDSGARQHRLEVAAAALRLSLARKRGHLAEVVDQVRFLTSPVTGRSDEDIALDSDLRAVALMNLGTVEAWSLGNQDSQRHLQEGADFARRIGRPYLEVACLAELAFASKIEPFATTRRRCEEAIAIAEQHGWGAEPVISPALVNLAGHSHLDG